MLKALAQLTRVEHSLMLAIGVLVGQTVALGQLPTAAAFVLAAIPPALVSAASFAINDYFDLETDRRNKKTDRPLVRGDLSPRTAVALSAAFFAAGIALSALINTHSLAVIVAFSAVAILYSWVLSKKFLLGNIYIAAAYAIVFAYGAVTVGGKPISTTIIWALTTIALLTGLGREFMKSIQDMAGDRAAGRRTVPIVIGAQNTAWLTSITYLAGIALTIYLFATPSIYYLDIAYGLPVAAMDVILLWISVRILSDTSQKFLRLSRNLTLVAIPLGLIGFLAGALI